VEPLFLDSAFVIALMFKADQKHSVAQAAWKSVTSERRRLVTTTFVFDEAVTFLSNRGEHQLAVATGNQLLTSPAIEMVDIDREWLTRAWEYFVRHDDKAFSLTDCLSFVIMNKRAMFEALTFDGHFEQAGFRLVP
jgi:uncharacterized protein